MTHFINHTYEEHIINQQNTAEKEFLELFEKEKPNLENAHVIVNPYLVNPLAALILFKTKSKVSANITIHGKRNSREDIIHTFNEETSHIIPIVGLYEGIKTRVSVKLSNGEEKEFMIEAQELPKQDVSRCRSVETSLDYFGTDFMFLTPAAKNYPVAFDYRGDIRWILTINTMFDIKRMKNGNIMTGSHRFSRMPYHGVGVVEMTLVGKIIKEFRMPGNYHHDQFELSDGNVMVLTQDFSTDTVEDMIALLDRETGKVLKTWDYKKFLPQNQAGSGSQSSHDWFHCNALWVNEKTKCITISGRHQDAIANFNYETNTLNWIIGDPEGWSEDMQKYFFKPVGDVANFDWQYEQHSCIELPNGDIMAFDNGHFRSKVKDKYLLNRDNFSRGVRYKIDTEKMEIEQVWQYGKELGQDFFSAYICNVEYYSEGHYLIHSGGIGTVDGFACDGVAAYLDVTQENQHRLSKTIEQKDGVVRFFLEVDDNFYRAERLNPYHKGQNHCIGEGKILGELDITPTFDTIPEVKEVMEIIPLFHDVKVCEEIDKLVIYGTFERGSMVMFLLEGDNTHAYYINTAAEEHKAMCSGAFLEKDSRALKHNISKRGLSGKYDIKIIVNDKKYQTGVSIYC